jgi:hypothetical protein
MAKRPRKADGETGAQEDASSSAAIPDGFVGLTHAGGCVACAVDGTAYEAGEDGVFIVQTGHAAGLVESHGFSVVKVEE